MTRPRVAPRPATGTPPAHGTGPSLLRPRPLRGAPPGPTAAASSRLPAWLALLAAVALALLSAGCLESPTVKEPQVPAGKGREAALALLPSVVDVRAQGGGIEEGRVAIGTGVVVEEGGFVVTNDHVLTGNGDGLAAEIEVVVDGGERLDAVIVGRDPAMDLAVLRVERGDLPVASFLTRRARVGQYVLAVGAPRTLDDGFAAGEVTAVNDDIRVPDRSAISALLETDAPLQPGYSGGPVADRRGRVLGISIGTTMGEGGDRAYAIPTRDVLRTVRRLLRRATETPAATLGAPTAPAPAAPRPARTGIVAWS